jgi:ribonuclease G
MPTDLLFSRAGTQVWAALRENGRTVELRVEDDASPARVGRIVKARVVQVVPALQAAFVDIGEERHAFLAASELVLPGDGPRRAPIQDRLREGRDLIVQIERESGADKGDRVTGRVGLPGRRCVYFPHQTGHRVSRRIRDEEDRRRLHALLDEAGAGEGAFVARTAARSASESVLRADASLLVEEWRDIVRAGERATAPAVLREELPLASRMLRDLSVDELPERVLFDAPKDHERARAYLAGIDPDLAGRLELDGVTEPLFDRTGVSRDVERARHRRGWLRSGGYLVIEQTEALVSIDVNTGKSVRRSAQEQTTRETNLEAAQEIARQLRLRDLGGIVVIDLVDTAADAREEIVAALDEALRDDPARTRIVDMSDIGLLQMTRRRSRTGPAEATLDVCPACRGGGRVRRPATLASRAIVELRRRIAAGTGGGLVLRAHPDLIEALEEALEATPVPAPVELRPDGALPTRRFEVSEAD